jgi:hypothetical protein
VEFYFGPTLCAAWRLQRLVEEESECRYERLEEVSVARLWRFPDKAMVETRKHECSEVAAPKSAIAVGRQAKHHKAGVQGGLASACRQPHYGLNPIAYLCLTK